MPYTLLSAIPREEIANIQHQIPPPGPYTAARFARWDNFEHYNGTIYLTKIILDLPPEDHAKHRWFHCFGLKIIFSKSFTHDARKHIKLKCDLSGLYPHYLCDVTKRAKRTSQFTHKCRSVAIFKTTCILKFSPLDSIRN